MVDQIDSAERTGSPGLMARFLESTPGPLPAGLAEPAGLMASLRSAGPSLRAWGYLVRIGPGRHGEEVVSIDGTSGRVPWR